MFQELVVRLDRGRYFGLHRGQVIELVDHSNVQIFDAGLAVYALRLRCPSAPIRPPLSMILFRSTALQPASYIPCCISVDSEPSFFASSVSPFLYIGSLSSLCQLLLYNTSR